MSTRAQCRAGLDNAAKKVGHEALWRVLAAIINGDNVAAYTPGEDEARLLVAADETRANADSDTTRHGRKKSVLLKDTGAGDSAERGTTRHGRRAGILVDNE